MKMTNEQVKAEILVNHLRLLELYEALCGLEISEKGCDDAADLRIRNEIGSDLRIRRQIASHEQRISDLRWVLTLREEKP